MSMRTLIEVNHDYAEEVASPDAMVCLKHYIRSGSRDDAERLRRFGIRVVGMRHHADKFVVEGDAEGFPPHYLPTRENPAVPA